MAHSRQIPKTASIGSEEGFIFEVWIGTSHVADLIDRRGGSKSEWELAYTPEWEASPRAFALSPALPLGRRHVGAVVSNFFENFLPEGEELAELRRTVRLDRTNAVGMAYALRDDLPGAIVLRVPRRENGKDERGEGGSLSPSSNAQTSFDRSRTRSSLSGFEALRRSPSGTIGFG